MNTRLSLACLFVGLVGASACQSEPYGNILNGKACSASGECAEGYSCVEGTCVTTWVFFGQGGDAPNVGGAGSDGSGGDGSVAVGAGGDGAGAAAPGTGGSGAAEPGCLGPADCGPEETCNGEGVCVCTSCNLPSGAPCANNGQCVSGSCAAEDGICCDNACTGTCVSCKGADTGSSDGSCAPIEAGLDPANECQGNKKCDGAGECCNGNGNGCDDD